MSLKITSFKKIGYKQTYNLKMKGNNHNYLLSNKIVSANSHAVAYSVISYQTAWLKTYYPIEFYCALLNNSLKNRDDLVKYIYALKDDDLTILPPDINESDTKFIINSDTIIFGLAGINGLGIKACDDIIKKRKEIGRFKSIEQVVRSKINKGAIKGLCMSDALAEITELSRGKLLSNFEILVDYYDKLSKWEHREERIVIRNKEREDAITNGLKIPRKLPKNKPRPESPELLEDNNLSSMDRLRLEREALGFYLTGHPMDKFPGLFGKYTVIDIKEGKIPDGERIRIPGVISSLVKRRTHKGQNMATLKIEDRTGRVESTIFPNQWKRLEEEVKEDTVCNIDATIKVTQADIEDSSPIIRLIVNNVTTVDTENNDYTISDIILNLKDGTEVKFIPDNNQKYITYQRACAIVSNIRKMG